MREGSSIANHCRSGRGRSPVVMARSASPGFPGELNTAHAATTRSDHRRPRADRDRAAARRCATGSTELRLSDLTEPDDLVAPEMFSPPTWPTPAAVQARGRGVDAVVHLGAVPNEAAFEADRRPEPARRLPRLRGVPPRGRAAGGVRELQPRDRHVRRSASRWTARSRRAPTGSTALRRSGARRSGACTSTGSGSRVVCLRIGSFQPRPRERRELATWLTHADGVRLVPGGVDRRRRRLRDRLRRVGQHAPVVAGGRARSGSCRRMTRRRSRTSSTGRRTTSTRAARTAARRRRLGRVNAA